jgi:phenylalanyl-tRNA synthetase alpha chain
MKERLEQIRTNAINEINNVNSEHELMNIKANYLGKKSELSEMLSGLKDMSIEDKKLFGGLSNVVKNDISDLIEIRKDQIMESNNKDAIFDYTLPVNNKLGSLHPVTIVGKEVVDILTTMGFQVVSGPEMESEYYNFEALNVAKNHPARDMQDTYWLDNGMLLRTHTSPCQVRAMEKFKAPLRIIAPGRCFRNEDIDASHENTFFQLEGMVIDKEVSISNLIYVMKSMLSTVFKQDVKVRLRPGYFPFVEPGFELDVNCLICGGVGCPTCKQSGWLELCPCGMVHPNVLTMSGIDPNEYTGFAFGLGLTRLAMMKYKIKDIRVLNSGDLRSLDQFNVE